jgi:hypothetical protein
MRGYGGGGGGGRQAQQPRVKQARLLDEDDQDPNDEEESGDRRRPTAAGGGGLRGGNGNSKSFSALDGLNERQQMMLEKNQLMTPLKLGATKVRIVSHALQAACLEILDNPRTVPLDEDTRFAMEQIVQKCEDEFTRIDPLITISKTISTGHCNIYVKEVVPVSRFLIARALHATFVLQITGRVKTDPQPFDDNEINVRPFRREANSGSFADRYASFGLAELDLERQVNDPDTLDQVEAHMISLGPLKPVDACNPEWLEDQQETVSALLKGERVAMKPKPIHF